MNTATIELPEDLVALARKTAQDRHIGLSDFFTKAVHSETDPPWLATFGELSDLHDENKRIMQRVEKAFGQIEHDAWK